MTEAPLAISFVDRERAIHGTARSGLSLLFEGQAATSHAAGPALDAVDTGWRAVLEGQFELEFSAIGATADLSGVRSHVCRVSGVALGTDIDGMGVVTETVTAPRWDELVALRQVHALFDPEHAAVLVARRPVDAGGHGDELVTGQLLSAGELLAVEDARLSTIYDGDGRPRQAGLELWLPGEDFPRRAFGAVTAGASLAMDGLDVHAAVMSWRMEGREGAGIYELTVREPAPDAA
jgi:hypothetical protein